MLLGNGCRRAIGTAVLTSAVFLLPLGAQSASAHEATPPAVSWAWGHHDDGSDHGDMCRDHRDHRDHKDHKDHRFFRHKCDRR